MRALLLFVALGGSPVPLDTASDAVLEPALEPVETLSLEDAVERLRSDNPDLEAMAAAIDDAEAVALQSLAAVKPFVGAAASYVRNNDEATLDLGRVLGGLAQSIEQATGQPVELGAEPGETVIQPIQSLTGSVHAEVPLFAAHAYWDIKAARAAVKARRASRDALLLQLQGALVRAAWLAAAAEAFVEVAEQGVKNSTAHWETATRLFESGRATSLTVEQAQLRRLRRQSALLEAQAALASAQGSLGTLLGRGHPVRVVLPDGPGALELGVLDDDLDRARASRPEFDALAADERAARHRRTSARMRYAPGLVATAAASSSTAKYVTGLHHAWQVGVSLRWTIYAGGARRAGTERAEAGRRRKRAERRELEARIERELRDARREFSVAQAKLELATREVEVARRAEVSAQRTFAEGRTSSIDVLDTLDAAFEAELRLEEARARRAAAWVQLQTARGAL